MYVRRSEDVRDVQDVCTFKLRPVSMGIIRSSRFIGDIEKQPPALKSFTKFTGKHLSWRLYFKKVAGLRRFACDFLWILQNFLGHHFHETPSDDCSRLNKIDALKYFLKIHRKTFAMESYLVNWHASTLRCLTKYSGRYFNSIFQ